MLLFRRPDDSALLAGTWELPWFERAGEIEGAAARGAGQRRLARRYGGRWRLGEPLATVRHGITHRAIGGRGPPRPHSPGRRRGGGEVAEGPEAGWFDAAERAALPLSSLVGKVLAAVSARGARRRSQAIPPPRG